jgi:hypothetical protein
MAPEPKGIQRVECMIDGTIELAEDDGSLVYYDAHLEALEGAEARAERIDARYVQCRAEMLEESQRAQAAEQKLQRLREGLEAELRHLGSLQELHPMDLDRHERRLSKLLDTYSVDEGNGA